MTRFVLDAEGALRVDVRQRAPGRGAWLHLRRSCIDQAVKRGAFARAFEAKVSADSSDQLTDVMRAAAEQRALDKLGLARRAGATASGIESVRRAMKLGDARFVCLAADASEGTRQQLATNCERKQIGFASPIGGERMARAMGQDYISAAAITGEPFASELESLCTALDELGKSERNG